MYNYQENPIMSQRIEYGIVYALTKNRIIDQD